MNERGVDQPLSLTVSSQQPPPPTHHFIRMPPKVDGSDGPAAIPVDLGGLLPPHIYHHSGFFVQDHRNPAYHGRAPTQVLDMKAEGSRDKEGSSTPPAAHRGPQMVQQHVLQSSQEPEPPKVGRLYNGPQRYYEVFSGLHAGPEGLPPPEVLASVVRPDERARASPHYPVGVMEQRVAPPQYASPIAAHPESALSMLSLNYHLQKYPIFWHGLLGLKNDQVKVQMQFVSGSTEVAREALLNQQNPPTIRISQRMRLEQSQLEGVSRKISQEGEHAVLIAVPNAVSEPDHLHQANCMYNGFIKYLGGKQAAGIVNVTVPGSPTPTFVIHIFPPCDFSKSLIATVAPGVQQVVNEVNHLLIVIATC